MFGRTRRLDLLAEVCRLVLKQVFPRGTWIFPRDMYDFRAKHGAYSISPYYVVSTVLEIEHED